MVHPDFRTTKQNQGREPRYASLNKQRPIHVEKRIFLSQKIIFFKYVKLHFERVKDFVILLIAAGIFDLPWDC